jgi:hypothetical protein
MNIQPLEIKDRNIILWTDESYYMYIPGLVSRNVSNDVSHNVLHNISNDVSRNVSHDVSNDVSRNVSHDVSRNVSHDVSRNVLHNISNDVSNDVSRNVSHDVSNDVSRNVSNDVSRNVSHNVSHDVSPNLLDYSSRIKVNVTIDNSYKNMYSNEIMLIKYIDNLNSLIKKVHINWDSENKRYFIYIKSKMKKFKIYINIYIDIIKFISKKRKILTLC